jgi:tetracycline repressor-like protein
MFHDAAGGDPASFLSVPINLQDDSEGYEQTDVFIKKTVKLAFELIRSQVIDSAFDLGKFLFRGRACPRHQRAKAALTTGI